MKVIKITLIFFIFFLFTCSKIIEPVGIKDNSDIQKELLKRVFLLKASIDWCYEEFHYYKKTGNELMTWSTHEQFIQKLKNDKDDVSFKRVGVLRLSGYYSEDTEILLIDFLRNDDDTITRFNAAQVLAFYGKKYGIDILLQCATGELVLSSSSYERNAAALALLLLDEKLPKQYTDWQFADPIYLRIAGKLE